MRILCVILLTAFLVSPIAKAAESDDSKKFLSQLVWCTDKPKPSDKDLKELDKKLGDKVRRIFKWKNYFEISRRILDLPTDDGKRIRISNRCEVVVRQVDEEQMEVVLYGDKKLAGKAMQRFAPILKKGEHLVIGGDDKDNYGDAWLLVISAAPVKK